jgi:hypothetical protein
MECIALQYHASKRSNRIPRTSDTPAGVAKQVMHETNGRCKYNALGKLAFRGYSLVHVSPSRPAQKKDPE